MAKLKREKKFDPEGTGYDTATARKYGYKPTPGADGKMHWQSRSPETGLLLKGRKHKTWDLLEKGEKKAGYTITKGKGGRYYSFKTKKPLKTKKSPKHISLFQRYKEYLTSGTAGKRPLKRKKYNA